MKKHLDPNSDDNFINYVKMLEDETQYNKRKNKKVINEVGDSLADEMSLRSEKEKEKRKIIINKIDEHKHDYNIDDLFDLDVRELYKILNTLEHQNRGFFKKLSDLLTKK